MKKAVLCFVGVFSLLLGTVAGAEPAAFKIALLPDTQGYTAKYPEIFKAQTEWIADPANEIVFMLHQGDITNDNSKTQWEAAGSALHLLDGKVPYSLAYGNHDIGTNGKANSRQTLLNEYFPYDQYAKQRGFGGAFEPGKIDNTWSTFHAGGLDWLVLSLEFGPRNAVLDWANKVVAEHPEHKVIVNTHAYMYSDDLRMKEGDKWLPKNYPLAKTAQGADAVNNPEDMWEKFISRHPDMLLVFSGHVLHDGTGRLVSEGIGGNKVYQMLANYQPGVIGSTKGGNGFLRIVTIDTQKKTISVQSYSPYTKEFKTEPDQQFIYENVAF